jgi:outer membrane protein
MYAALCQKRLLEKYVKVRALTLFAVALMGLSQLALADTTTKFGFVNSERVMREAAPAVRAQQRIEKEFSKRDQELQRMAKDLEALQKEMDDGKLSDADRLKKEKSFTDLNREFQRKQREFREDLNQRRNEELASVVEKATQAIKKIAEAEKYDVILQDVVYANPRVDITDKVLKALADLR